MHKRKTLSTAAALGFAAGILLMPAGTFARGAGGFAGGAHGPVFGFPHARGGVHRPLAPALAHRVPARLGFRLNWWRLHRFARHRSDAGALYYPLGSDGGYAAPGDPNDVTGAFAPGPALLPLPPAAYPPEHVGCLSRGYDVPGESGGVARVTVTRC